MIGMRNSAKILKMNQTNLESEELNKSNKRYGWKLQQQTTLSWRTSKFESRSEKQKTKKWRQPPKFMWHQGEEKGKGIGNHFNKPVAENIPSPGKDVDIQV
jgi:hypothetical protein